MEVTGTQADTSASASHDAAIGNLPLRSLETCFSPFTEALFFCHVTFTFFLPHNTTQREAFCSLGEGGFCGTRRRSCCPCCSLRLGHCTYPR